MTIRHILTIATTLLAATSLGAAPRARVTASIDSAVVEMGSRAVITVTVSDAARAGHIVDLPEPQSTVGDLDIVSVTADTLPAGLEYKIQIQAYTPGVVTLAPFRYAEGTDTAESDIVTLKVNPVELDSLTTINPMVSITAAPSRWYDWIPVWVLWVLLGVAVAAIGLCLWLIYRKHGTLIPRVVKPVDPYVEAMDALARLRDRKLAETGHEKEYYTSLVDILRRYLDRRFGINAMEMSSTQILSSLHDNPETRGNQPRIRQILELADFVKFAKVRPMPDDNIKTYNGVVQFVEETRPQPEPEAETADTPNKTPKK